MAHVDVLQKASRNAGLIRFPYEWTVEQPDGYTFISCDFDGWRQIAISRDYSHVANLPLRTK